MQISFEKDKAGTLQSFVINAGNQKEPLTFDTFLRVSTETILGMPLSDCKIKKGLPLFLYYEKNASNQLVIYFDDANGKKTLFSLNNLLYALPETLKGCNQSRIDAKTAMLTPENRVQIFFEDQGGFHTFIKHTDGRKEKLAVGNLLAGAAELLAHCKPAFEENRVIYVYFDDASGVPEAKEIDAYGTLKDLNFDNLITAAAETLQVCPWNGNALLNQTAPSESSLQIRFEKSKGHLETFLFDVEGKKIELNLGTLLSAGVGILPNCDFDATPNDNLIISFEKKSDGSFQAYLVAPNGSKKELNVLKGLMDGLAAVCYTQG